MSCKKSSIVLLHIGEGEGGELRLSLRIGSQTVYRPEDCGGVHGLRRGDVQAGQADHGGQAGGEAGETGGAERGIIGPDCDVCNNIRII